MRKCGIVEMRERLPRCTYSSSHFPNIPIFSLPYSHILTLHSANYVDLVLKLAAFVSDTQCQFADRGMIGWIFAGVRWLRQSRVGRV